MSAVRHGIRICACCDINVCLAWSTFILQSDLEVWQFSFLWISVCCKLLSNTQEKLLLRTSKAEALTTITFRVLTHFKFVWGIVFTNWLFEKYFFTFHTPIIWVIQQDDMGDILHFYLFYSVKWPKIWQTHTKDIVRSLCMSYMCNIFSLFCLLMGSALPEGTIPASLHPLRRSSWFVFEGKK